PASSGRSQVGSGRGRNALARHLIMIGVAGVHLVDRQHVRLAAESADPLDAPDEVGSRLRLDAPQLTGRRAGPDEPAQLLIDRAFDAGEIAARLGTGADHELP